MARKFLVSLDLTKNELLNARIQNLPTASRPSSPVSGQIYYDTTDNFLYFFNGTTWLRASGDFGVAGQTTSLYFGNTKSDGISNSVARADHTHDIPDVIGTSGVISVTKDQTSGDATFDLVDTGVTDGSYGSQTKIPTFTVDPQGRLTAAGEVDVATTLSINNDGGSSISIDLLSETLKIEGGEGIDVTNDGGNKITIAGEDATHLNKGIASFEEVDFEATSGHITIREERIQDIVGKMVESNTESGIAVVYDDANGKIHFDTHDVSVSLSGDISGSGTLDLNNTTFNISTTIQPNSVALGTDTTGNYVAGIQGTTDEIEVTNSGGEGSTVTIGLPQDVTISRHLTVNGNLDVVGAINSVSSTQVNIVDNKINLNSNLAEDANPILDSGLVIHRGIEEDALLTWNETLNRWEIGLDNGRQYPIARKFAADLAVGDYVTSPNGTTFVVNHGLNTRDVQVSVQESTDAWSTVETDVERTSIDTVTIRFGVAPAAGAYRVVITG